MQRRSFLARAGAGAGVGAALVAAPAITNAASPAVRWRGMSGFPASLDTVFGTSQAAAKRVADTTGGSFQISVAPPGEIVPMLQAADAVGAGTIDCAHVFTGWYVGQDPIWGFVGAIPFGLSVRGHNAWWFEGGGQELFNTWLRPRGMVFILSGNTGTQMGGWFRREIRTMDDVRGLKMRIAGLGGNVWHAAGAVPQQIPGGEIYSALERGTIDAAEFIGPADDERLGFQRVARFYYHPGFWEGGSALGWIVNLRSWEALPADYREAFTAAAHEANTVMMARYDTRNAAALRRLIAGGTQLRTFPRPVLQAFFDHAQRMYGQMTAANADFKRLYDSYTAFQREQVAWMRLADNSFDSFMVEALRPRPAAGAEKRRAS